MTAVQQTITNMFASKMNLYVFILPLLVCPCLPVFEQTLHTRSCLLISMV